MKNLTEIPSNLINNLKKFNILPKLSDFFFKKFLVLKFFSNKEIYPCFYENFSEFLSVSFQ